MILFSAVLIPILSNIILFIYFREKTIWWEFLIPFAIALLVAGSFKLCIEKTATSDVEYWGGTIEKVEYYEPWNEYISKICTESYPCGTDSKGNTQYCTRTYDCSYVDYHSAYWEVTDNNGINEQVSQSVYNRLVKKFGNNIFVELNRDYYTQDGNKYVSTWPESDETIEHMVTEHSYENRVQAARDIFNYPVIDTSDINQYKLYEYPKITGYYDQLSLLGKIKNWELSNRKLDILNAKLGNKKQVKVFVLLFRNQPREAAFKQEALWKGGNKNELIVCIGLNNHDDVMWCYPFSWTENQIIKVNIRTYIESQKIFYVPEIVEYLYCEIDKNFVRKQFKEFSYLTVEPTTSEILWTFSITFILTALCTIWIIKNQFTEETN